MPLIAPSSAEQPGDVIDVVPNINLDNFTLQDLLKLRADIERRLPARNLKDLNLQKELVLQFLATQELQNSLMHDTETPANQRAQVMNATASILQQLAKLQSEVHTSERLKSIENKLIEALNALPEAEQSAFLAVYEEVLGEQNA